MAQEYDVNVFRYLILNCPYNQVINWREELIQQALNHIQKIIKLLKKLNFYLYTKKINLSRKNFIATKVHSEVIQHLLNNLNTVKVLHLLEKTINLLNKSLDEKKNWEEFETVVSDFHFILDILGFKFALPPYDFSVKLLIKNWQIFQTNKQYNQADEIRSQLQKKGIL